MQQSFYHKKTEPENIKRHESAKLCQNLAILSCLKIGLHIS